MPRRLSACPPTHYTGRQAVCGLAFRPTLVTTPRRPTVLDDDAMLRHKVTQWGSLLIWSYVVYAPSVARLLLLLVGGTVTPER